VALSKEKMTILDTIFNAYFAVVPLSIFAAIMAGVFVVELFYTFTTNWDMV
jgi:hypothetical protein